MVIEGPAETPFQPSWTSADDPDGDQVAYIWQLAATPAFTLPLLTISTAADTFFTATYGTIAALLTSAGIQPGQSITLYHRPLSTDGSLVTRGQVDSVSLTLGVVTGFDEAIAEKFQVQLFPVPADQWVQVEVTAPEQAAARLQVYDQSGRLMQQWALPLGAGVTTHRLDVQALPAGAYFLQLFIDGKPLRARKIAVQH